MSSQNNIRNFCIIAHIDHGKSTLADRFLELTETVTKREMKEQLLDSMDLERERGITIKLQPATMKYKDYVLNLIDTPGHVDFGYEVSRSLAAVEGALLLVDASQGIQAQTLANLYLAVDQDLEIIPVLNKIDLPASDVEKVSREIINLIGCKKEDILAISAKTGEGVLPVLDEIIKKVRPPKINNEKPLRALIFDSFFDKYRGVVAEVRIIDGTLKKGEKIKFMASKAEGEVLELGIYKPKMSPKDSLQSGDIGYIITGLKKVDECRVGDTVTKSKVESQKSKINVEPLTGYEKAKSMVYAGLFCKENDDYTRLREAIKKLKLNDAALTYEPENSPALGFGFRCGFLGMLHLDIVQERLNREYGLELIITAPSVGYRITKTDQSVIEIKSPQEIPDIVLVDYIEEPIMKVDIVTPKDYIGSIMELSQNKRGEYINTEFIDDKVAILHYKIPLANLIIDFYDQLKSKSAGYASLNYDFSHWQKSDVAKMDIIVAEDIVESLSIIVYRDEAFRIAKKIVKELKELLPRQMFEIKIQAAIGAKVIASERISAIRKDVTAKLYGGDFSRKRKLLENQKAGKKKMKSMGKVDIPPEAFMAVLKR